MKDIKAKVVTKPTGNKKPNKPATVAKRNAQLVKKLR